MPVVPRCKPSRCSTSTSFGPGSPPGVEIVKAVLLFGYAGRNTDVN